MESRHTSRQNAWQSSVEAGLPKFRPLGTNVFVLGAKLSEHPLDPVKLVRNGRSRSIIARIRQFQKNLVLPMLSYRSVACERGEHVGMAKILTPGFQVFCVSTLCVG